MPPGTDAAIAAAAAHGYESVVIVVVMLSVFTLTAWLVRFWIQKATEREDRNAAQALAREERLAARVTELERLIHDQLMAALKEATLAMREQVTSAQAITQALTTTHPCWWTAEKQGEVLAQAADRIAEHLIELIEERVRKRSV
jgi:hypothetical protein